MEKTYVSRAGSKLEFAINQFGLNVTDFICADLGCSTGGFTDCLLEHGAAKVFAVDTGYGVLAYKLRRDPRVKVHERTNALFFSPPQPVDLVTIDVSWTPQHLILPHAKTMLKAGGFIISLIKPHYEAHKSYLTSEESLQISRKVADRISQLGFTIKDQVLSPVLGEKGKNQEYLFWICPG
jgi:23S rRNA (cytidine1920-2'-O)/16S rRNA (cytidine1409-2'-O)-methyltransferase